MARNSGVTLSVMQPTDKETMANLVERMFADFYELVDQTANAIWLSKGLKLVKVKIPKRIFSR